MGLALFTVVRQPPRPPFLAAAELCRTVLSMSERLSTCPGPLSTCRSQVCNVVRTIGGDAWWPAYLRLTGLIGLLIPCVWGPLFLSTWCARGNDRSRAGLVD